MKSWLLQSAFEIRHSYWFIPTLMAVGATVLAASMVALDIYYIKEVPSGYEWLFRSQPAGARALLSTVAGSTITVAGVVFSMTIMAVSHATSNYGSRLLLKFLKDLRNQIALGTFIATFIYCLLVLRTVSGGDAGSEYSDFVPHIAVLGALGMALASVAVLIMFIHHVPDTIHIGDVAADRGTELVSRLGVLFPISGDDEKPSPEPIAMAVPSSLSKSVYSDRAGYFQALDVDGLIDCCQTQNLLVKLLKQPGDFINQGEVVMLYDTHDEKHGDSISEDLFSVIGIGRERTPAQDVRYLIEELSQISVRALSPGINDPFTAITCLDWLGSAVAEIADRENRPSELSDEKGVIRVILRPVTFADICDWVFATIRSYVVADRNASLHMAKIFTNILSCARNTGHKKILIEHFKAYQIESLASCESDNDQRAIREHYDLSSLITEN